MALILVQLQEWGSQSAQECAVTQKKVLLWTSCKALSGVSTSHCFKLFKGLVFLYCFNST